MINCPFCGVELPDDTKFCTACGTKIEAVAPQTPAEPVEEAVEVAAEVEAPVEAVASEPVSEPAPEPSAPTANETYIEPTPAPAPIPAPVPFVAPVQPTPQPTAQPTAQTAKADAPSMKIGSWLLTFLLLIIPVVDIVMLILWACGKSKYKCKVAFARAFLIVSLALGILLAAGIIVLLILFRDNLNDIIDVFKEFVSSIQRIF